MNIPAITIFTVTMQSQLWMGDSRPHQMIIETVAAETLAEAIAASQKRWPAPDYVFVSAQNRGRSIMSKIEQRFAAAECVTVAYLKGYEIRREKLYEILRKPDLSPLSAPQQQGHSAIDYGQAAQIEITEEMIAAGMKSLQYAFSEAVIWGEEREAVCDVFQAMLEASTPPANLGHIDDIAREKCRKTFKGQKQ